MGKRKEWEVTTEEVRGLRAMQPARIADRYSLPQSFVAVAQNRKDPRLRAEIMASVENGKVVAKEVHVWSEDRHGIGTRTLQSLPVRELLAEAASRVLGRVEPTEGGWKVSPVRRLNDEAAEALEQAVGYKGVRS